MDDQRDSNEGPKEDAETRRKTKLQKQMTRQLAEHEDELKAIQREGVKLQMKLSKSKTGNVHHPHGRKIQLQPEDNEDEFGELDEQLNDGVEDTVGAVVSSDSGNFTSDDDGHIFAAEDEGIDDDMSELGGGGAATKNTIGLIQAEKNRAFYDALDSRMDLLIRDIVKPLISDKENGTIFIVKYSGQTLKMRFSELTRTFGDVRKKAAQYFGLPEQIIFLSDKEKDDGVIYMNENILRDELFPLQTAQRTNETSILYVILKRRMNSVNFLENDKDLKIEVAEAVKEVEQVADAIKNKEETVLRQKQQTELVESIKDKIWQRKKLRGFVAGILHVVFMQFFITVFYQTHNQVSLVQPSYYFREEVCRQFLDGPCSQMPKQFRSSQEAYNLIGHFEDKINDESNTFFYANKLRPWVRVTALRIDERQCYHEEGKECRYPLHTGKLQEEEFDGASFDDVSALEIRSRFNSIPSTGNSKTINVLNEETGQIIWREQLVKEVWRFPPEVIKDDYTLADFSKREVRESLNQARREEIEVGIDETAPDSWLADPTRALFFTLSFINQSIGMTTEVKLVIQKTELGLFQVYLATNRFRMEITQSSPRQNLVIMAFMNVALVTVTLFNIKTEREEKLLIEEEQKRLKREAQLQAEGGLKLPNILTEESSEEEERDEQSSTTLATKLRLCCIYTIKFRFLKDASVLNLLDFAMNVLCSLQVILVFAYSSFMAPVLDEMLEKKEWIDHSTEVFLFDLLNSFQALLYILMAISQIKTLVFWLPDTFRIVVDIFDYLINRQTAMIMLCAMSLSTLGNEFFSVTLGANFINFYRTDFLGIRSSVVVSQGWFYHRDTIYGLTEGIESLPSPALACLYFAITFYLILFSIIIAGMYTGRMLEGLLIARAKGKTLRELKYKNELNIIELEINAKKKKIDQQRNKL